MDAAEKTPPHEARLKTKATTTKLEQKPELTKIAEGPRPSLVMPPDPPNTASLFDALAPPRTWTRRRRSSRRREHDESDENEVA